MVGLTAADFADTGQWRLIINIGSKSIAAYLENTIHEDLPLQMLFRQDWEEDPDNLLHHIENVVYDHPRVLDDFSARIVIDAPKTLFCPTELVNEAEGTEEDFYTAVYKAEANDLMCETDGDITAVFTLVPGLKDFLSRTFPGARIGCRLMQQVIRQRHSGEGAGMFVAVYPDEADFVLTDGPRLISASTHPWTAPADILYHILNLFRVYGVSQEETSVKITGDDISEETIGNFRQFIPGLTTVPSGLKIEKE
jgi:hypothetical protein